MDDNIVILDHTDANHDDSECDSDTLSIRPEAPPEIPSDKDIVKIDHNHDDSDGDSESDSDTLSIETDALPDIPSDNDNTISSEESTNDETETQTYEIIDELLTEDIASNTHSKLSWQH